jgi:TPR repeat protein
MLDTSIVCNNLMMSEENSFEQLLSRAESGNGDAMFDLAKMYAGREDAEAAERWFRGAAELGNAKAMNRLGDLLEGKEEFAAAEEWFRKGAELENRYSMYSLGFRLEQQGDLAQAEEWYRKSAERGEEGAMDQLGFLLQAKGDLDGAEEWFRRAAELGSAYAMGCLGTLMKRLGDLEQAEEWFRRAALEGRPKSMNALGVLLRDGGRPEEAEEWFLMASNTGLVDAINNLAYSLNNRGKVREAEAWIRKATEQNNGYAWNFLGNALEGRGELAEAERCFHKAVEAGYNYSLLALGRMSHARREMVEAELCYRRAVEEGVAGAEDALRGLEGAVKSAEMMDAITFDTFGWAFTTDQENLRLWRGEHETLTERFIATDFDFTSYDEEELRHELKDLFEQMNSDAFDISDLEIPEELGKIGIDQIPKQSSLLDLERFELENAKCLLSVTRHRMHDETHYASSTFICFAECFWLLGMELDERELVGAREAAVARLEMDERDSGLPESGGSDPYDPKWDGLIPIEDDPLTRIRQLTRTLLSSVTLSESAQLLKPLTGEDE